MADKKEFIANEQLGSTRDDSFDGGGKASCEEKQSREMQPDENAARNPKELKDWDMSCLDGQSKEIKDQVCQWKETIVDALENDLDQKIELDCKPGQTTPEEDPAYKAFQQLLQKNGFSRPVFSREGETGKQVFVVTVADAK